MLSIKVESNGRCSCNVKTSGLKNVVLEACAAIHAVHEAIAEVSKEDADSFKLMFYRIADNRALFDEEPKSPEDELRENLVKNGMSESNADKLVDIAKKLVDALGEVSDDADD